MLRVDPVYDRVQATSPREECDDVPVDHHVDGGNNNAAGTVIGAIVGGVLGNTVGKGDGRKAATVAGAVVGGAVGHGVASQDDRYYTGPERRCRMVQDAGRRAPHHRLRRAVPLSRRRLHVAARLRPGRAHARARQRRARGVGPERESGSRHSTSTLSPAFIALQRIPATFRRPMNAATLTPETLTSARMAAGMTSRARRPEPCIRAG